MTAALLESPSAIAQCRERWNGVDTPSARVDHIMAYDSKRGVTVLFGGVVATYGGENTPADVYADTWEFDGRHWRLVATTGPSLRSDGAMAYDSARGVCVMFGGNYEDENGVSHKLGDTWEWDGVRWMLVATDGPSKRYGHAMCYDAARGMVLLTGAVNTDHTTWGWDGTTWTQVVQGPPSDLFYHQMAYDNLRDVTVVYDGYPDAKTWELSGDTWTLRTSGSPSRRVEATLIYDNWRGQCLLFGGYLPGPNSETWVWDGVEWQQLNTVVAPYPRHAHAMVFDENLGIGLLFGGSTGGSGPTYFADTWEWNGAAWSRLDSRPVPRRDHAIALDEARDAIVLFGGRSDVNSTTPYGDFWEFHASEWEQKSFDVGPTPRYGHALAYDRNRHRIVMFGGEGQASETWEWDGATWTLASAGQPVGPVATAITPMAYHDALGAVFLVSNGQSWTWDGAVWTALSGAAPDVYSIAYDPSRNTMVGISAAIETWEFQAGTWNLVAPTDAGAERNLVYDPSRRVIVNSNLRKTFEWNGVNWQAQYYPFVPGRLGAAYATDTLRQVPLVHGGTRPQFTFDDFLYRTPPLKGDLNNDGIVSIDDLAIALSAYGINTNGDVDLDGDTDIEDLAQLLAHYAETCP